MNTLKLRVRIDRFRTLAISKVQVIVQGVFRNSNLYIISLEYIVKQKIEVLSSV
ncbi:hypothetical protein D3C87_1445060 [compost metagenome]